MTDIILAACKAARETIEQLTYLAQQIVGEDSEEVIHADNVVEQIEAAIEKAEGNE